jgi:ketosteroid isomerase-like protein
MSALGAPRAKLIVSVAIVAPTIAILRGMELSPLERIQRGLGLFNEGAYDSSIELLPQAIEWDTSAAVPDGAVYRGREELLGWWRELPSRWDAFRIEAERWIESDHVVLMVGRLEARGIGSGVPVVGNWDQVWRIVDGEPVRCENYTDRARAFAAAGNPMDSA